MRHYPALRIDWPAPLPDDPITDAIDLLLAELDGTGLTAVEPMERGARVFFSSADDRARAHAVLAAAGHRRTIRAEDVPDENWAERSQASIGPVRVGRLVVAPPWCPPDGEGRWLTILPSMGFGTGHHATTRLCLALLQELPLAGRSAVDVGTGSGVLAVAAWALGARPVTALDHDPDALASAQDSLDRNGCADAITLRAFDLDTDRLPGPSSVVVANLTGALLTRQATALAAMASDDASMVLSGLLAEEAADVVAAFEAIGWHVATRVQEGEWVALRLDRTGLTSPSPSTAR